MPVAKVSDLSLRHSGRRMHQGHQRLWVSSLTDEALLGLGPIFAQAVSSIWPMLRAVAPTDWLIGLNATRAMTCRVGCRSDQLLSVGRVQTPTLALIVQRDEDIANVSEKFWRVTAEFEVPTAAGEAENAPPEDTTAQHTEADASAAETPSIRIKC